ncbi:hypothetical protein IWQ56_005933, partial [Coemansia nantahalensis]
RPRLCRQSAVHPDVADHGVQLCRADAQVPGVPGGDDLAVDADQRHAVPHLPRGAELWQPDVAHTDVLDVLCRELCVVLCAQLSRPGAQLHCDPVLHCAQQRHRQPDGRLVQRARHPQLYARLVDHLVQHGLAHRVPVAHGLQPVCGLCPGHVGHHADRLLHQHVGLGQPAHLHGAAVPGQRVKVRHPLGDDARPAPGRGAVRRVRARAHDVPLCHDVRHRVCVHHHPARLHRAALRQGDCAARAPVARDERGRAPAADAQLPGGPAVVVHCAVCRHLYHLGRDLRGVPHDALVLGRAVDGRAARVHGAHRHHPGDLQPAAGAQRDHRVYHRLRDARQPDRQRHVQGLRVHHDDAGAQPGQRPEAGPLHEDPAAAHVYRAARRHHPGLVHRARRGLLAHEHGQKYLHPGRVPVHVHLGQHILLGLGAVGADRPGQAVWRVEPLPPDAVHVLCRRRAAGPGVVHAAALPKQPVAARQ